MRAVRLVRRKRGLMRPAAAVLLVLAVCLGMSGCSQGERSTEPVQKTGRFFEVGSGKSSGKVPVRQ